MTTAPNGFMSESDLDHLQRTYRQAVDQWLAAIREEEALASVEHSLARLDRWEQAHMDEEDRRGEALKAKKAYEDALRQDLFGF